jgi:hypothetical protein
MQGSNNYLVPAQANEGFGFESIPVNLFYRRVGMVMISSTNLSGPAMTAHQRSPVF